MTYHADTAVKYQTFTNVCPKLQNNVRLNSTFTVPVQPNAQGINVNTSYVTPIVAVNNKIKIPVPKKASSGNFFPRFSLRHIITFVNAPAAAAQMPNTTKTRP